VVGSRLIVQMPRGGRVEQQLRSEPPAGADAIVLDAVEPSRSGRIEPPTPGQLVYSVPSPEQLPRERDQLRRAVGDAGTGQEPLVIAVEAASELREDELAAALDAVAHAERPVILAVLGDG
jgi:hypothetical protein